MKKFTTANLLWHSLQWHTYFLLVLAWLCLGALGYQVASSGGWFLPAPWGIVVSREPANRAWRRLENAWRRGRARRRLGYRPLGLAGWLKAAGQRGYQPGGMLALIGRRGLVAAIRSLALMVCGVVSGEIVWQWLSLVPGCVWGWQTMALLWPRCRRQPGWQWGDRVGRRLEQVAMIGGVGLGLSEAISALAWLSLALEQQISSLWPALETSQALRSGREVTTLGTMFTGVVAGGAPPGTGSQVRVRCEVNEQGEVVAYSAELEGRFTLTVAADNFFRRRLLILFLRLLEEPGHRRRSRRTREGRTPAVRQQALAAAYHVTQPEISRWERYWQNGDWRRLLSERAQDILTLALQERVVAVFAQFPWWGVDQVYDYLHQAGETVSQRQVRQAAQESGWSRLRQELQKRYHIGPACIQARDNWLVTQLLTTNQMLLAKVEAAEGLTPQEQRSIADLTRLATEGGSGDQPGGKGLPWAYRLEQLLFGHWEMVTNGQVRCLYCHSEQVSRKSRQPRRKSYYDDTGQVQTLEVYRYYCHNVDCDKGSFTHLPPGLLPYSPYRQQTRLLAWQLVVWSRVTYRRSATALAVAPPTLYRWLATYGRQLLPVAAIFGVVRCSGVVGVDEKYVLVPKNDKPQAKMKRWCYVYLAVDSYTYDLLHIAIYAHRDEVSTRAFLLDLRAKGYRPQVVVTDLWPGYAALLADIFPQAAHQECIFHALQELQRLIKTIYGPDYVQTAPQAAALKQAIYHIFAARSRRTAQKRYQAVMALADHYTQQSPEVAALFRFLEGHWPKLVNAIDSPLIPTTNNATELVIRRFDQHYQNFCGFDSLPSAQLFLAVFEKCYRFTPFSADAQPHLRGKCPLELAGYDITQLPMTVIAAGRSPDWPLNMEENLVPNL
jgi:transposase-like protein